MTPWAFHALSPLTAKSGMHWPANGIALRSQLLSWYAQAPPWPEQVYGHGDPMFGFITLTRVGGGGGGGTSEKF